MTSCLSSSDSLSTGSSGASPAKGSPGSPAKGSIGSSDTPLPYRPECHVCLTSGHGSLGRVVTSVPIRGSVRGFDGCNAAPSGLWAAESCVTLTGRGCAQCEGMHPEYKLPAG